MQCSQLGAGVDEACCPQYTTCAEGYNATTTLVRCDIQELALQSLTPSEKSSMGEAVKTTDSMDKQDSTQSPEPSNKTSSSELAKSTSATSSTDTDSLATQTTQATEDTSIRTPGLASITYTDSGPPAETASIQPASGNSLGIGAMIGIIIGAAAAVILLLLAVWFIWRKRRRTASQADASAQQHALEKKSDGELQDHQKKDSYSTYSRRHEMEDTRRQELWGGSSSPKEMQTREVAELDGSAP